MSDTLEKAYFSYFEQFTRDRKLKKIIKLPGALESRYMVNTCIPVYDKLNAFIENKGRKYDKPLKPAIIFLVCCDGIGHDEKIITEAFSKSKSDDLILIDLFNASLSEKDLLEYNECSISSDFGRQLVEEFLKKWVQKLSGIECKVYSADYREGKLFSGLDDAYDHIEDFSKARYSLAPDWQDFPEEVFNSKGVSGEYIDHGLNRDEGYICDEDYLKSIQGTIKSIVDSGIKNGGRVGFSDIVDVLKKPPYGFINNAASAVVLGQAMEIFLDGTYYWTNGLHYDVLTAEHLKSAITKTLQRAYHKIPTYIEDYLVVPDESIGDFISKMKEIFSFKDEINSPQTLRNRLRYILEDMEAPLWAYKDGLSGKGSALIDSILEFVRGGDVFEIEDAGELSDITSRSFTPVNIPRSGDLLTPEWKWIWTQEGYNSFFKGEV